MKAENRIVKTTEENCHNTLEERLAEQDRISFKAGYKEALEGAVMEGGYESVKKAGIREVVEWVEGNIMGVGLDYRRWQAFKKKRGIE